MDKVEKAIRYNALLKIYGDLLSETQKQISEDYFEYDLSLAEIAENNNISRSAAEDAIKKSVLKLDSFESTLHIFEKNSKLSNLIDDFKKEKITKEEFLKEMEELI